jgi:hypothetical protein
VFGTILITIAALLLIVVGYSDSQIEPVLGLTCWAPSWAI